MARADAAGTYNAEALVRLLPRPSDPVVPVSSLLLELPSQAEIDRPLSSYEVWVQIDIARREVAS